MDKDGSNLFFSIVIPAHNEEKYIVSTLEHIKNLDYPQNKLEVVVVENGSKDNTLSQAEQFQSENIKIVSLSKNGVSHAKNEGIKMISPASDWTVILDADTLVKKDFLKQLNVYLSKKSATKFSVGTTYVRPIPDSLKGRLWFMFYDWGHRLTKASYAIQVVRTSVLKQFHFNETLAMGEDLELIAFGRKQGKFFVFPTKDVSTSTRRFENEGWFHIFFVWTFVAMLPNWIRKDFSYKVVR